MPPDVPEVPEVKEEILRGLTNESPLVKNRILEHRIHMDDEHRKDTWTSCCLTLDRRAVHYFTQLSLIVVVMGFSIAQLIKIPEPEGQQVYLGLLTTLIGVLLPSPKFGVD